MKEAILNLLFKRNYYDRSIYTSVLFLTGSVAALASKSSWIDFFRDQLATQSENQIVYLLLAALQTFLLAGSWPVAILSILLVGVLLLVKYKVSTGSESAEHYFDNEFKFYQKELDSFQFKAAFRRLKLIEDDIKTSTLLRLSKRLNAKLNFLLGEVATWVSRDEQHWLYIIKAFEIESDNLMYKERACVALYHLEDGRAETLANQILLESQYSGRAWAIKLLSSDYKDDVNVPSIVRSDKDFVRICAYHLMKQKKLIPFDDLMTSEVDKIVVDEISIARQNVFYYNIVAGFCFDSFIKESRYPLFDIEPVKNNKHLNLANKIFYETNLSMSNSDSKDSELYIKNNFYYLLTSYMINPDRTLVGEITNTYIKNQKTLRLSDLLVYVFAPLFQHKQFADAIYLSNSIEDNHAHFFKGFSYFNLQKPKEGILALKQFISGIHHVDRANYEQLGFTFNYLLSTDTNTAVIFDESLSAITFFSEQHKLILKTFANLKAPDINEQISELEVSLGEVNYALFEPNTIKILLDIYFHSKDYEKCINILQFVPDYDDPIIEIYRLRSLSALNRDLESVIQGYRRFRSSGRIMEHLLIDELNLCIKSEYFEGIKDAARVGLNTFGSQDYKYYLLFALNKLKEYEELDSLLSINLLNMKISWEKRFDVCYICVDRERPDLAIEIAYSSVISDYSNPLLKERYFHLFMIIRKGSPEVLFEKSSQKLTDGYWAIIANANGNNIIANNKDKLYQEFIGMEVHAEVFLDKLFNTNKHTLVKIISKYEGLYLKINEEITNADPDSSPFHTIAIKYNTVSDFETLLIEKFGKESEMRKIRIDEAFKSYFRSQISFAELVTKVKRNDPLPIYHELVNNRGSWNAGLITLPIPLHKFKPDLSKKICLDITVIPLLYELSKDYPEILKCDFISSYYVVNYLESQIKELYAFGPSEGTLHIEFSGIHFRKESEGVYENQLLYYRNLLDFVKEHLNPRISFKRMEEYPDDKWYGSEWYFKYMVDTYYLAQDGILVSEDRVFQISREVKFISAECFLKYKFPSIADKISIKLLERNYKGIFINHRVMFEVYMYPMLPNTLLSRIMDNLPNRVNHHPAILDEVLDFIRDIYSQGGNKHAIRQTSQAFLKATLTDYPNLFQLKDTIADKIKSRFNLLGYMQLELMEDFIAVFKMIELENQSLK